MELINTFDSRLWTHFLYSFGGHIPNVLKFVVHPVIKYIALEKDFHLFSKMMAIISCLFSPRTMSNSQQSLTDLSNEETHTTCSIPSFPQLFTTIFDTQFSFETGSVSLLDQNSKEMIEGFLCLLLQSSRTTDELVRMLNCTRNYNIPFFQTCIISFIKSVLYTIKELFLKHKESMVILARQLCISIAKQSHGKYMKFTCY